MAHEGWLVISDITGYSSYVNHSELEHARDSLSTLLSLLIEYTRSPLVIAKLEGDAVFSCTPKGGFMHGQSLLEMMENTYAAFRKASDLMVLNTTCDCRACRNLPNLDLKFFVHYGQFDQQKIGQYSELVGNDVNLVHRLVKNRIEEVTGPRAYAAYTNATIEASGMHDMVVSMQRHSETFADVGKVTLFVQDMHGVWERKKSVLRIEVRPDDALLTQQYEFPVPPAVFWDYITQPQYRKLFMGSDSQRLEHQRDGRIAIGSEYVCAHGPMISRHTILDWRPFEQYTTNESHPLPGVSANYTYRLESIKQGTRLSMMWGRAQGPLLLRLVSDVVLKLLFSRKAREASVALRLRIQGDLKEGHTMIAEQVHVEAADVQATVAGVLTTDNKPLEPV